MKRLLESLFILILATNLTGCDTYSMAQQYPYYKSAVWLCEDPYFEIRYTLSDGNLREVSAILELDGALLPVGISFMGGSYEVYEYIDDGEEITPETYFSGSWKYRGNNLVLSISGEYDPFYGKYDEIVLVSQP